MMPVTIPPPEGEVVTHVAVCYWQFFSETNKFTAKVIIIYTKWKSFSDILITEFIVR